MPKTERIDCYLVFFNLRKWKTKKLQPFEAKKVTFSIIWLSWVKNHANAAKTGQKLRAGGGFTSWESVSKMQGNFFSDLKAFFLDFFLNKCKFLIKQEQKGQMFAVSLVFALWWEVQGKSSKMELQNGIHSEGPCICSLLN